MFKLKRKHFLLFVFLLVVIIFTAIGFSVYNYFNKPISENGNETVTNIDSKTTKKNFNVLLLGTDVSGVRTDAIMLVNINTADKKINMISIPRDTKITINGEKYKINSLYSVGGLEMLIDEVKALTNAPINYYALIKPGMFAQIVDVLGGVEYNVERNMKYSDPTQDLYIDLKSGVQILSGDEAEQYCRYRSYVMGDLTRTECQQKLLKAVLEQKLNVWHVTDFFDLYNVMKENIVTNVTLGDLLSNISVAKMISEDEQINCFEIPGDYNDMEKEGVCYYLIEGEALVELRSICEEYFSTKT